MVLEGKVTGITKIWRVIKHRRKNWHGTYFRGCPTFVKEIRDFVTENQMVKGQRCSALVKTARSAFL